MDDRTSSKPVPVLALASDDHRVMDVIEHMLSTFQPQEFDAVLVKIMNKNGIKQHLHNAINASGIWENVGIVAAAHKKQMGLHTWKMLQAVTSVLHRPGHQLSAQKLEGITGLKHHMFEKTMEGVCTEVVQRDRSSTRNPHRALVVPWAERNMMPSPHSTV